MARMEDLLNEINKTTQKAVTESYRDDLNESENLDVTDEDLQGLGSGNMATLLGESILQGKTGAPPKRNGNTPEKPAAKTKPETKSPNNVSTKVSTSSDEPSAKSMTESQYIQFLETVLEAELEYDKESLTEAAMEYHNVL